MMLDEATSALGCRIEHAVQRAPRLIGGTHHDFIAHRLATVLWGPTAIIVQSLLSVLVKVLLQPIDATTRRRLTERGQRNFGRFDEGCHRNFDVGPLLSRVALHSVSCRLPDRNVIVIVTIWSLGVSGYHDNLHFYEGWIVVR